ncbi:hypothetical protein O181_124203 [Austropuccinia psidii MF-1]|uniref:Uncharacterized protein n=1 Tax=Austropuccinia psidii MF-1 TaxID=1389203 RepID=A0A9Q3KMK8_9BASI|nr:hypothetical protein [Austropuccinia psidii MF-1]
MCPHPPPDETPTLPPHLRPHHSLRFRTPASSSPWLKILMLLRGPQVIPPMPPSHPLGLLSPTQHASNAAYHPYALSALPTLLTILTLAVPSQHASDAAYHLNTCGVPSQHASNAPYHPYSRGVPA